MSQRISARSRRPRRSEQETADLVLAAAVEHVAEHGLHATLDLPMEEIIAAADVARATAYRLWPTREEFTAAALDRIAEGQTVPSLGAAGLAAVVREVAATADGAPAVDIACRLMALAVAREWDVLVVSDKWRAYVAFETVVASVADDARRTRLLRGLTEAEAEHTARLAELYAAVAGALGLRESEEDALLDAAHAARVLARGLLHEAVRDGASDAGRATNRRRLSTAAAALVRGALRPTGSDLPPAGWPEAVARAVHVRSAD